MKRTIWILLPLLCIFSKLSARQQYIIQDSVLIETSKGHTLSAVVIRKQGISNPQPAALLFFIYSDLRRNIAEAKSAADHGYVGVVADVRGKRLSSDEILPYENEQEDVYEVIDWISRQAWSNGQVGMYGGSYSGFAQWAALKHRIHPALKTIVPYVAGIPGKGLPMENNVFINPNYQWAFYVGNNRYLDTAANNNYGRWRKMQWDWYNQGVRYRKIDSIDGSPNRLLQRWLMHPAYDNYWQDMVPYKNEFVKINIPVLAIDGYYNDGQASGLFYFQELKKYNPNAQDYLVIGPYDHFGAQRGGVANLRGYQVDSIALINTRELTFAWFDFIMKGAKKPELVKDHINFQVMGSGKWKHVASLKEMYDHTELLYLANTPSSGYYTLSSTKPKQSGYVEQSVNFSDRDQDNNYNFPDPIIQDSLMMPNGFAFISKPAETTYEISGAFTGELKVSINKKDLDYSIAFYELLADGRFFELSYYLGRASYALDPSKRNLLTPGIKTTIPFSFTKLTSKLMTKGSRLLIVVNVNKNRFAQVNYGTGKDVSDESITDAVQPLIVKWYNDSFISIPIGSKK